MTPNSFATWTTVSRKASKSAGRSVQPCSNVSYCSSTPPPRPAAAAQGPQSMMPSSVEISLTVIRKSTSACGIGAVSQYLVS